MYDNGNPQQIFSCDLHLLNVLRLHRSFADHIQAHWNNIFPLAQSEGSRAPHSSDFYGWPHFLYTCVRVYITDERKRRSSQHSSFLSNFIATVFMVLNLNQIMSIIFNVPAIVISTVSTSLSEYVPLTSPSTWQIAACRAVRRLTNFTYDRPEVILWVLLCQWIMLVPRFVSAHAISSNNRPITRGNERVMSSLNYKRTPRSEVHVRVSFWASWFSLWRLNMPTSIVDGDLHARGRQSE